MKYILGKGSQHNSIVYCLLQIYFDFEMETKRPVIGLDLDEVPIANFCVWYFSVWGSL